MLHLRAHRLSLRLRLMVGVLSLAWGVGSAGCSEQEEARAQRKLAQESLEKGRRDEAMRFIDTALALSPNDAPSLALKGQIQLQAGNFPDAIKALTASLALDPNRPDVLLTLAQVHHQLFLSPNTLDDDRLPNLRQALALYLRVAEADPFRHEVYLPIGEALETLGQPSDAIDAYTNAILTNPSVSPEPSLRLARLYARLNFPSHALAAAEAGLQLYPNHVELSFIKAQSSLALNQLEAAAEAYTNAISFFTTHLDLATAPPPDLIWRAHLGRARAYVGIARVEAAERQRNRANSSYIKALDDLDAALRAMPPSTKAKVQPERRGAEVLRQHVKHAIN